MVWIVIAIVSMCLAVLLFGYLMYKILLCLFNQDGIDDLGEFLDNTEKKE